MSGVWAGRTAPWTSWPSRIWAPLPDGLRAECLIVRAGARVDLDQAEAAIAVFEDSDLLRTRVRSDWACPVPGGLRRCLENGRTDRRRPTSGSVSPPTYSGAGPDAAARARELADVDIVDVELDEWLDAGSADWGWRTGGPRDIATRTCASIGT